MIRSSGEVSRARGVYHSDCKCRTEIRVRVGDRFPNCPTCHRTVVWHFTRSWLEDPPRGETSRDS